jgi:phosphatidylserine/phosphatidylglycerophosphate/cardiolipin synthase-like enzyme
MSGFEDAVVTAASQVGSSVILAVADRIAAEWPDSAILGAGTSAHASVLREILDARRAESIPPAEAVAFLRGVAAAHARQTSQIRTEIVWSGPSSHAVPVRSTAQALIEVISEAERELVVMTYSARPHEGITEALKAAIARGVDTSVVVETLQGAGSALAGAEPATAFAGISGVHLWHWPVDQRSEDSAKMHAKLAVADRRVLLVSSANLTMSGVTHNIEAGVLVRGGAAPVRAAEHIADLKAAGVFGRMSVAP